MELLAASGRIPAAVQVLVYAVVLVFAIVGHLVKATEAAEAAPPRIQRDVTGVRLHDMTLNDRACCPVCRMTVEPVARVVCTACRTPHHKECWRYNTGCATFACGERNYTL